MAITTDMLHTHDTFKMAGTILDGVVQLKQSIAELEAENAELKESQRWRKCYEKLPEKEEWVFVSDGKHLMLGKRVDGAWIFDGAWMPEEHGVIKYWMPLPKVPEEG